MGFDPHVTANHLFRTLASYYICHLSSLLIWNNHWPFTMEGMTEFIPRDIRKLFCLAIQRRGGRFLERRGFRIAN